MRIAIAGGNGFIGRELTLQLLEHGHEVAWLSHRPGVRRAPSGVHEDAFVAGDPGAAWAKRVRSADAVVNLSGHPIASRWNARVKRLLCESRLETTKAITAQIAEAPASSRPRVLVNASAVGIYGEAHERLLDESSPLGDDWLASLAIDWEEAAREAEAADCRVVRIRTGIVLGDEGVVPRMVLPMKLYVGGPIGSGRQWVSWIHHADIAGLYRFAVENEQVTGAVNACSPEAARMSDFARTLGDVLDRPSWLPVPRFALDVVLGEVAPYTLMSQHMTADKALSLGYEFAFPNLRDALSDLVGRPSVESTAAQVAAVQASTATAAEAEAPNSARSA